MTPERVEEELFGGEDEGGLSGPACSNRRMAARLFLDEIADMPLTTQARSCAC